MKNENQAVEKIIAQCMLCGARQRKVRTTVIDEAKNAELLHIQCGTCKGSIVALLFNTGQIVSSIGVMTDLNEKDLKRIYNYEPLSQEDLMELHQALQKQNLCESLLNNY